MAANVKDCTDDRASDEDNAKTDQEPDPGEEGKKSMEGKKGEKAVIGPPTDSTRCRVGGEVVVAWLAWGESLRSRTHVGRS